MISASVSGSKNSLAFFFHHPLFRGLLCDTGNCEWSWEPLAEAGLAGRAIFRRSVAPEEKVLEGFTGANAIDQAVADCVWGGGHSKSSRPRISRRFQ
jgi:hypothetical protein